MNLIESLQIDVPRMTSDTTCIAKMNLNEFHKQPQGYLNGGATLAFAEIIAGMMSNELVGSHKFGVGQSITANHLRPVKCEGTLTALGTLLVKGKTSHVWRFDMIDDAQRLISQVTVTIQNNKKNMTKDIKVLMRHLGDGTWVIYDIPDIEDLYTITRK